MKTTLKTYERKVIPLYPNEIGLPKKRKTFFQRLKVYIAGQHSGENRFKWVGIVMATQAFLITPFIAVIVVVTGNWIPLWFVTTATMYATFIPVLAGLPVKQILTVYFINLAASILIIAVSVLHLISG